MSFWGLPRPGIRREVLIRCVVPDVTSGRLAESDGGIEAWLDVGRDGSSGSSPSVPLKVGLIAWPLFCHNVGLIDD